MAGLSAVSLISNKGNIGAVVQDLTSQSTFKSVLFSMITAGLNTKIMAELGIGTPVQAAASKIDLSLSERLQSACVRAATGTTIHTIDGDSFQDSLLSGVISGTADVIAGLTAHEVGDWYKSPERMLALDDIDRHLDYVVHKLLHGAIGAGASALSNGDALSGAIGGIVGEIIGEAYVKEHPEFFDPTHEDYNPALREQAIEKGITFAKTSAAFTAFISGQDPNIAAQTAENAVVENAFFIPVVIGGLALYEAYEIYDIFDKQGPAAAAEKLIEIGIMTAVGAGIGKVAFKIGSKVYPSAEAAFMAYKSQSPLLTKITENLAAGGKKASRFIEKMTKFGRKSYEQEFTRFWTKPPVQYKGKKVYQRDDLIDPYFKSSEETLNNLSLMKIGKAPYGFDGKKIELHHMLQSERSPIAEVTQMFHKKYSRVIHINPGSRIPSGVNRNKFKTWKKHYWIERAKDF